MKNKTELSDDSKRIRRKIYVVWKGMRFRCYGKVGKANQRYQKKGIKVCDQWLDDFEPFYTWALNNSYREGLELDRENNDGDYCPDNCRFVTPSENQRNKGDYNVNLTVSGRTQCVVAWEKELKLGRNTIFHWMRRCTRQEAEQRIKRFLETDNHNPDWKGNYYTIDGITKSITGWADYLQIKREELYSLQNRKGRDGVERRLTDRLCGCYVKYNAVIDITIGDITDSFRGWERRSGISRAKMNTMLKKFGIDYLKQQIEQQIKNNG